MATKKYMYATNSGGNISAGDTFSDKFLVNPNPTIAANYDPVGLSLPWDEFIFRIRLNSTAESVLDSGFRSGRLTYPRYRYSWMPSGWRTLGYYYGDQLTKLPNKAYEIRAVSGPGLLERYMFKGAIWQNEPISNVLAQIIDVTNFRYNFDVADDVAAITITGALPPMTKREALSAVLLVTGASLINTNLGYEIRYNAQSQALKLGPIASPQKLKPETVTNVIVTEHSFFASAAVTEQVAYDNTGGTAANNLTVYFDEPYQSYRATGLTINDSGPFYVTVSGNGVIYGTPYVHIRRELSQSTGLTGGTDLRVDNCELINPINASAVLTRLKDYYKNANFIEMDAVLRENIVQPNVQAGSLVEYTDPFTQAQSTGYVTKMDLTISRQDKARLQVVTNWTPHGFGNAYDSYVIVKKSDLSAGKWNVPVALQGKDALIHIFSGAQGGQGGAAGGTPGLLYDTGNNYDTLYERDNGWGLLMAYDAVGVVRSQAGGKGGAGGHGGKTAAKMLAFEQTLGSQHTVSFGSGGAGGSGGTVTRNALQEVTVTPPAEGSLGGASSFDGTSTDTGSDFEGTYVNMITGEILATQGESGTDGGDGGAGGQSVPVSNAATATNWPTNGAGKAGGSAGTHTGGAGGAGKAGIQYFRDGTQYLANAGGGGGGGASIDANGSAGSEGNNRRDQFTEYSDETGSVTVVYYGTGSVQFNLDDEGYYTAATVTGAKGGNGAAATTVPAQAVYHGGHGGHGGGGGGANGQIIGSKIRQATSSQETWTGAGLGGIGGNGAAGGQGSDGFMIVYYKA